MTDPSQQSPAGCYCSGPVARTRATTGRGTTGNLPKATKQRKRRASRRTSHPKRTANRPAQEDPLGWTRHPRSRGAETRSGRPLAPKGARRGSSRTRHRRTHLRREAHPPEGGQPIRGAKPHQQCPPASPSGSGQECYAPTRRRRRPSQPGTSAPGGRRRRSRYARPSAPPSLRSHGARRPWPCWVKSRRSWTPTEYTRSGQHGGTQTVAPGAGNTQPQRPL